MTDSEKRRRLRRLAATQLLLVVILSLPLTGYGQDSTASTARSLYRDFSEEVDPRSLLEERHLVAVSRWANAVIDRQMLRYNFAAKPAWPDE